MILYEGLHATPLRDSIASDLRHIQTRESNMKETASHCTDGRLNWRSNWTSKSIKFKSSLSKIFIEAPHQIYSIEYIRSLRQTTGPGHCPIMCQSTSQDPRCPARWVSGYKHSCTYKVRSIYLRLTVTTTPLCKSIGRFPKLGERYLVTWRAGPDTQQGMYKRVVRTITHFMVWVSGFDHTGGLVYTLFLFAWS